jgi:hypothetical protein
MIGSSCCTKVVPETPGMRQKRTLLPRFGACHP